MRYFNMGGWVITITLVISVCFGGHKLYAYRLGDVVILGIMDGCGACEYSEIQLKKNHIPFITKQASNVAPELYVNGVLKGYGTDVIDKYIGEK